MFQLVGLLATLAIGLAYLGHVEGRSRRDELGALATKLGLSFDPSKVKNPSGPFRELRLFNRGRSRATYNTIYGNVTIGELVFAVQMGDFTYTESTSRDDLTSRSTHHLSYIVTRLSNDELPDLLIRPKGPGDRFRSALGAGDIEFESDEFNERFYVGCSDKRFAYAVIHPRMMEFLSRSRPCDYQVSHSFLCLSIGERQWAPRHFEHWLGHLRQFVELWPDWLLAEFVGGGTLPAQG